MRWLLRGAVVFGVLLLLALGALLWMIASAPPPAPAERDVFGFAGREDRAQALPALQRFRARDGTALAYRLYPSDSRRLLVFVHGSSYHGGGYHALASALAGSGAARVVLPNLRGHHLSGPRRGDVDYQGQLEDDLADLIAYLRGRGHAGPVVLGGHSSGGGMAIRFAGGAASDAVQGYLVLAPAIPLAPSMRGPDAGGWATVHRRRLIGLVLLNALGIHGFDGLPVIHFNKPAQFWDGTETLTYSYRLNASYHPRPDYGRDLAALPPETLVLVGEDDEAIDPRGLADVFGDPAVGVGVEILPGIDHFGIVAEPRALARCAEWLVERF